MTRNQSSLVEYRESRLLREMRLEPSNLNGSAVLGLGYESGLTGPSIIPGPLLRMCCREGLMPDLAFVTS